jgi:hypothetical protein
MEVKSIAVRADRAPPSLQKRVRETAQTMLQQYQ